MSESTAKSKPKTIKFKEPGQPNWKDYQTENDDSTSTLREMLRNSLQMPNLIVLAGSGTSLGAVGGPSMSELWEQISKIASFNKIKSKIKYSGTENIEHFLSHCDAFLEIHKDLGIQQFVSDCKKIILEACSSFLKENSDTKLSAHRTFLHRLSRRGSRSPRLKVFTTNYDLCFEQAAASQSLIPIDGFSFSKPRKFDPRFFGLDIVRRSDSTSENNHFLEGIFHLLKLHGSVNWTRGDGFSIEENENPTPENACLIYPAKGKYQQSFMQPHLELISQFLHSLREPNTCLLVIGYGFNDDHLSEAILSAVRTNPNFRLIVVGPNLERNITLDFASGYWHKLDEYSDTGNDLWLIQASFSEFSEIIPDLKALTPAQKLENTIKALSK
jgi:hypothetical protein